MPTINHWGVLVTVVASQVLGFVWYSVAFGKAWAVGYRLDRDALDSTPTGAYIATLAGAALYSYALAILIGLLEIEGVAAGIALGAMVWAGIVVPRYLLHALFGKISVRSIAIDSGFDLIVSIVTGAILAAWLPYR